MPLMNTIRSLRASLVRLIATRPLLLILALAAFVRVVPLLLFPLFRFEVTGAVHGSDAFDRYATGLLTTGVYGLTPGVPDAQLPPLYSYMLAALYAVFGRGGIQVGFFHTALDLLSIALLYQIAQALFVRQTLYWRGVAVLGALFYAVYPYLIFQNLTLIDTPLFMTLMHTFVLAVVRLRGRVQFDSETMAWGLLAGVALGLATLVRPILPPLALLLPIWFLFSLNLWQTIARLLPVAVVSAALVIPWAIRNTTIYGEFVPMSLTFGSNFYQGSNPDVIPFLRAGYDTQWTGPEAQQYDPYTPAGDRERLALAWAYLEANPQDIPELLLVKFMTHWSVEIFPRVNPLPGERPRLDYQGDAVREVTPEGDLELGGLPPGDPVGAYSEPLFDVIGRVIHRYYFGGLFVLGLAGMVLSWRGWRDVSLLWLVQISMTFVYVLFHPSTRYRVPTDPLLFLFSAYTLVYVWVWVRSQTGAVMRVPLRR
jgi:4-amino-4-deoxy-L-arabinose transferase-like glycosyltransferase